MKKTKQSVGLQLMGGQGYCDEQVGEKTEKGRCYQVIKTMENTNEEVGEKFEMGGCYRAINNGQQGAIKLINAMYRWMILTLDVKNVDLN